MNKIRDFQHFIWTFYQQEGRLFEWRNIDNPYYVLISEIMLQQTQTHRVIAKYQEFIAAFPRIEDLAQASLKDVLTLWQGLGYNRRGKFLYEIAKKVVAQYNGIVPSDPETLVTLPGIGPNTAGSIAAFAYNVPTIFIETNIRTVFIHSFFKDKHDISDKELMPLVRASLDQDNPREWYYALMDYGVYLKKKYPNPNRKSKHYTKQSKFEGSDRQIRGVILRELTQHDHLSRNLLIKHIGKDKLRVEHIINELLSEQLIVEKNTILSIPHH